MKRRFDDPLARVLLKAAGELIAPQPPPNAILSLLANGGEASGAQLVIVLQRRRKDVFAACRALEREGKIVRRGTKWVLRKEQTDEPHTPIGERSEDVLA